MGGIYSTCNKTGIVYLSVWGKVNRAHPTEKYVTQREKTCLMCCKLSWMINYKICCSSLLFCFIAMPATLHNINSCNGVLGVSSDTGWWFKKSKSETNVQITLVWLIITNGCKMWLNSLSLEPFTKNLEFQSFLFLVAHFIIFP